MALPAYQQKSSNVPNAGIALRHVTSSDTGNYSVEVTGRNSNGFQFMLHRSAVLHVLGRSWEALVPQFSFVLLLIIRFFFFFFFFRFFPSPCSNEENEGLIEDQLFMCACTRE